MVVMLEYNDENLKKVTELILKNLSSDLLPRSWLDKNEVNLTFGHCHNAAGCLYKIFGSKAVNMYRGFDGEIYHWWVQDKAGKIIDLTADQYYSKGRVPPYDKAEKAGLLGFEYKNRVKELYRRVTIELSGKKLGLLEYYE
jgi:hypothetical protein